MVELIGAVPLFDARGHRLSGAANDLNRCSGCRGGRLHRRAPLRLPPASYLGGVDLCRRDEEEAPFRSGGSRRGPASARERQAAVPNQSPCSYGQPVKRTTGQLALEHGRHYFALTRAHAGSGFRTSARPVTGAGRTPFARSGTTSGMAGRLRRLRCIVLAQPCDDAPCVMERCVMRCRDAGG
jgi:hypothetical protein